jgi:hypothetical protein
MKKYRSLAVAIVLAALMAPRPMFAQTSDSQSGTYPKAGNNRSITMVKSRAGTTEQSHGSFLTPPNSNPGRGYKGGVEANNPPRNSP